MPQEKPLLLDRGGQSTPVRDKTGAVDLQEKRSEPRLQSRSPPTCAKSAPRKSHTLSIDINPHLWISVLGKQTIYIRCATSGRDITQKYWFECCPRLFNGLCKIGGIHLLLGPFLVSLLCQYLPDAYSANLLFSHCSKEENRLFNDSAKVG